VSTVNVSTPCLDLLDGVLPEATEALFRAYGVAVHSRPPATRERSSSLRERLSGVIGFTSPELMGSLVLTISDPILAMMAPSDDALSSDCLAELTNQLIGRMKNQLLKYGVALQLALPVVIRGQCLDAHNGAEIRDYEFSSEAGAVTIRLAALADIDFYPQPSSELAPSLEEGELTFF